MTLNDYANGRKWVVLFWTSVGTPYGDMIPLGYPYIDFLERRGLLNLEGTIDKDDQWFWDGKGNPTDDWGNPIRKLLAYSDVNQWNSLVEKYN